MPGGGWITAPGGGGICPGAAGLGVGNGGATPRFVPEEDVLAQPLVSRKSRIRIFAQCAICCSVPAPRQAVKRNRGPGTQIAGKLAKVDRQGNLSIPIYDLLLVRTYIDLGA